MPRRITTFAILFAALIWLLLVFAGAALLRWTTYGNLGTVLVLLSNVPGTAAIFMTLRRLIRTWRERR
jgi:hypothetical protein